MIYLGPAGIPITAKEYTVLGGIRRVAELGLNAMEVEFVRGVSLSRADSKIAGEEAKRLGVKLSVHCPYYINLCSSNPAIVEKSKNWILLSADRAHAMRAEIAVFHPGYYQKLTQEEALERVVQGCEDLRSEMKRKGIDDVLLGLETMGKQSTFGTLDEVLEVFRRVDGCIPVVDWAHIYARNAGHVNWTEIFDKLRFKPLHTHFTCVEFTTVAPGKGNEKRHLEMEANQPPFKPIGEEILKRKLEITIISESPVLERDSLLMKVFFERRGFSFKSPPT